MFIRGQQEHQAEGPEHYQHCWGAASLFKAMARIQCCSRPSIRALEALLYYYSDIWWSRLIPMGGCKNENKGLGDLKRTIVHMKGPARRTGMNLG